MTEFLNDKISFFVNRVCSYKEVTPKFDKRPISYYSFFSDILLFCCKRYITNYGEWVTLILE